jgi:hypothetical protein
MMTIKDATELNQQMPNVDRTPAAAETGESQSRKLSTSNADTLSGVVKDSLELSEFAKLRIEKAAQVNQYLAELQKIKSPTDKDIEAIRSRLKTDFYQKPEVIDKILEGLTRSPAAISEQVNRENLTNSSAPPAVSDRLSEIQSKIQSGFYDSEEVLDIIATRMLSENGP